MLFICLRSLLAAPPAVDIVSKIGETEAGTSLWRGQHHPWQCAEPEDCAGSREMMALANPDPHHQYGSVPSRDQGVPGPFAPQIRSVTLNLGLSPALPWGFLLLRSSLRHRIFSSDNGGMLPLPPPLNSPSSGIKSHGGGERDAEAVEEENPGEFGSICGDLQPRPLTVAFWFTQRLQT